jgi:leader peptidase (prepilin peptidase)/N-methyltransferase
MFDAVIYLALALLGLVLGSFAGATVWRLRARQLVADKKAGEAVDHAEYTQLKKLAGQKVSKDRSRCLHCSYTLRWYDLIPLVSWLSLRGRCRECHKPIGVMEPLIELGTALFFVLSYALWPYALTDATAIASLVVWLVAGVGLAIMFAYDAKWYLLPDSINFAVIGLGLVAATLAVASSDNPSGAALSVLGSVVVLSGIYYVLYLVSQGRWIGFGDIKLGLGLGLLLADWQLALIGLFLANLIGCLIVVPLLLLGKLKRNAQVPFGPLLIGGVVIAQLVGVGIVEFYTLSLM